jgi:outer membrane protein OmpA-like peptidoglycan-associated protein
MSRSESKAMSDHLLAAFSNHGEASLFKKSYAGFYITIITAFAAAAILSGCAAKPQPPPPPQIVALPVLEKTQIVLLPDPDTNETGKIEVTTPAGSQVLNKPYQATSVVGRENPPSALVVMEENEVREMFREALNAQPEKPSIYILYFEHDSTTLKGESLAKIPEIVQRIRETKSRDVRVSGHTDTTGSKEVNKKISYGRAKGVVDLLTRGGVILSIIEITYHGSGNPAVPTPQGVAEPRNRRVEISIR